MIIPTADGVDDSRRVERTHNLCKLLFWGRIIKLTPAFVKDNLSSLLVFRPPSILAFIDKFVLTQE